MRFTIILIFFSYFLSAQSGPDLSMRYVWAESGLVMRSEGNRQAAKLTVIPFGAQVSLTGRFGDEIEVEGIPSVNYEWEGKQKKSKAYVVKGHYVQVEYKEEKGYVFSGYLSCFPTGGTLEKSPDLAEWLQETAGPIDTVYFDCTLPECEGRSENHFRYANGITRSEIEMEGGGESVVTFPIGHINDGFLIGCRFFGFEYSVDRLEEILADGQEAPSFLEVSEDGSLALTDNMCEVYVRIIGGMLVISSGCWC